MRKLKIVGCTDPMMWYAGLVGQVVSLVREEADCYWSREPAGHINIVRKSDARAVWVDQDGKEYSDGEHVRCACGEVELKLSRNVTCSRPVKLTYDLDVRHLPTICEKVQTDLLSNVPKYIDQERQRIEPYMNLPIKVVPGACVILRGVC
ncbi:hypothetical protein QEL94_004336 [Pseudomonas putida]|nr:hypothetical protein [Pseudomonas putida]